MEQPECVCKICKSGENLFARVPDKDREKFGRGDKVKIVLVEKASIIKDPARLKAEIKQFLGKPQGEKMAGTIMGYPVEVPLSKFFENMPRSKAEKMLTELLGNE